jgi:hypothetical protein
MQKIKAVATAKELAFVDVNALLTQVVRLLDLRLMDLL